MFLPYLSGERAPIWNSQARGTFFGANLTHRQEHFVRAGLEGVMFGVLSVAQALKDLAGPAREVRASGGFTNRCYGGRCSRICSGKKCAFRG